MSLKDNAVEQREYLEKNLGQINTVISAILGYKTKLEIKETTNCRGTYFKLSDHRNIREKCGVMAKAFEEVCIGSFTMGWSEEGVYISFVFRYQHIDGGTNASDFCAVNIINDLVTIIGR